MKAFISALVVIGVVSVMAAYTLDTYSGSSQSVNTSSSVRIN